ncbi:helix-turn-helix domain-containing protein [Crateriforma conspicua]|uniref:helix-turn-helix domain-containing protein n=1 Tax=Crateriforma conspicua TaxID=2527996 RepID=UPI0018CF7BC1|nr:helix-turn-helix transcriptional regulator [Crateriforma conspicua]
MFCERVIARRKELGLTQLDMAERLRITQPTYSSIERGRRIPGIDTLAKIADALEIDPAQLLTITRQHAKSA